MWTTGFSGVNGGGLAGVRQVNAGGNVGLIRALITHSCRYRELPAERKVRHESQPKPPGSQDNPKTADSQHDDGPLSYLNRVLQIHLSAMSGLGRIQA